MHSLLACLRCFIIVQLEDKPTNGFCAYRDIKEDPVSVRLVCHAEGVWGGQLFEEAGCDAGRV